MGKAIKKDLSVPNDLAYLSVVRDTVLEVANKSRLAAGEAHLVSLAVDEALANVMEHAYIDAPPEVKQVIEIQLAADEQRIEVRIRDFGSAFDPGQLPDVDLREHVRQGKRGGLGVFLMRKIMDEVEYKFEAGKHNELYMVKYIDKPSSKG